MKRFAMLLIVAWAGPAARAQPLASPTPTSDIHAGHFFSPRVSLGAEVRMQVWLTDAAPVRNDPRAREQFTFAIGPRLHLELPGGRWLRPGVSYTRAFDDPWGARAMTSSRSTCRWPSDVRRMTLSA